MKSDKTVRHIAFIMDGNGRWATARRLPRNSGHREGIKTMLRVVEACYELNIPYVSFYAFSTENKYRSKLEVNGLIKLLEEHLVSLTDKLTELNRRLNIMGDISYFGEKLQKTIEDCVVRTTSLKGGVVNVALNYGGRDELERAARLSKNGGLLSDYLYTAGQPDPDILVRTGGEKRLSNFMLYQLAYTELFFSDTYWPDFTLVELNEIIEEYTKRNRRFGK